jgi:hypothetical protein
MINNKTINKKTINKKQSIKKTINKKTVIPKIIYLYWNEKIEKNSFIDMCINNITTYNPDFEIKLYNPEKIEKIINDNIKNKIPQWTTDWLRLYLLYNYGGVWCDISSIFSTSIDTFVDMNSNKLQGYGYVWDNKIIENFFMACSKKNKLIGMWLDEFTKASEMGGYKYCEQNLKYLTKGVDSNGLPIRGLMKESLPYLTAYLCFSKIIQILKNSSDYYTIISNSLDDKAPLSFLTNINWNVKKIPYVLLQQKKTMSNTPNFVKLTHKRRATIIERINNGQYSNESLLGVLLKLKQKNSKKKINKPKSNTIHEKNQEHKYNKKK